jgi:hypothetical protein
MRALHPESPANPSSRAFFYGFVMVAGLLALSFATFPVAPPDNSVDSSLAAVLGYARERRLQFGPDLALTYGPLGYLAFFYYTPCQAGLRLAVDVALGLIVAAGVCRLAWRLPLRWRWLLPLLAFWVLPNTPTRGDLAVYVGLMCWGLLGWVETGRWLAASLAIFLLLVVFGALAKVSFLFVGGVASGLLVADLALRGFWRAGLACAAGASTAFVLGWLAAGQHPAHLGDYLVNGWRVAEAYNAALGWPGLATAGALTLVLGILAFVAVTLAAAFAFVAEEKRRRARRLVLWLWLLSITFSVWKYGSVRSGREAVLLGFLALLPLFLEILRCDLRPVRAGLRALGVVVCVGALALLQQFFFLGWPASWLEPFRALARNAAALANPREYWGSMEEVIAANRRAAQLPRCRAAIGTATVDVFGQDQAYAPLNGLNYHPRPVFQSYVACTRPLMELNERFYRSTNAPAFVLFQLSVLDRKFPAMEDGLVLGALLANYQPVLREGPFLLLQRMGNGPVQTTLLREGTTRLGERIDLQAPTNADLRVEIDLRPSLAGWLRQFAYRPPTVRLIEWPAATGKPLGVFHAPAAMLNAGFLASPLLANTADVLDLYAGRAVLRPGACSVAVLPGEEWYWQEPVRFRLYKIENRFGRNVPESAAAAFDAGAATGVAPDEPVKPRDLTLFRSTRWHPDRPLPGGWQENLVFAGFAALPVILLGLSLLFFRGGRGQPAVTGKRLVLGNLLVQGFLLSGAFLAAETYYRYCYDTTDSLAFTKTCERWVLRHWKVNNIGSRDDVDYSPALTPGRPRVMFVGDSFTAGHGINNVSDRFPNRLRASHPDWDIQVLAAVGLDTGGELALMKKAFAKGCQADLVVLVYCLNDIGDLLPPASDMNAKVLARLENSNWLARNSYAANLWYFHYEAARIPEVKNYCAFLNGAYAGVYWDRQKERLRAFRDLVESHGARLAVVTFPFLHALGPNYEYREAHARLARCWQELGVPALDLLPVYEGLPPRRVTVNPYDAHPNEYANALAADAIDKWLAEGELLTLPQNSRAREGRRNPSDAPLSPGP